MDKKLIEKLLDKLLDSPTEHTGDSSTLWSENIGKYVIIRWYDSWVHFWKLEYASQWLYRLWESRRLRYRYAKKGIWLSSVALYWLKNESKVCWELTIEIVDTRISEIIPCTKEAVESIKSQIEYTP